MRVEIGPAVLYMGETREVMRQMVAAGVQVDSCVTDPPYEIGFMGRAWDSRGVAFDPETWRLALQLLKPGGHLLAFTGARTYHRIACAVEDAGFEIRDQIMWLYGSGFPKSMDVGKAIDKHFGMEREIIGTQDVGPDMRGDNYGRNDGARMLADVTGGPVSLAAQVWDGWGTALKPAHEPIILARKPLAGTVAATVLTHGTGAINIDGCRVGGAGGCKSDLPYSGGPSLHAFGAGLNDQRSKPVEGLGRFPANLVHDGSPEVLAAFPSAPGQLAKAATGDGRRKIKTFTGP